MKQCSICKIEKDFSEFCRDKRTKSGLYSDCRKCHYERYRKGKVTKSMREYFKEYTKKHIKEYMRKYRKNPRFRLDCNMASIISTSLKGKKAGQKWQRLVGYTIEDLIRHLEKQFDDKISWSNYGNYWEIDHIRPKSLFKYETAESPEFKKCWALENLQPLEKSANRRKHNKIS